MKKLFVLLTSLIIFVVLSFGFGLLSPLMSMATASEMPALTMQKVEMQRASTETAEAAIQVSIMPWQQAQAAQTTLRKVDRRNGQTAINAKVWQVAGTLAITRNLEPDYHLIC